MSNGSADIAAAIHALLDGQMETIFGDSIATIEDDGAHARIGFEHAPEREVDLVIGADGLHSRVRQIAFGPETLFEYPMGCYVASFEVAGYRPRDDNLYVAHTAPRRYIARFPIRDDKTLRDLTPSRTGAAQQIIQADAVSRRGLTQALDRAMAPGNFHVHRIIHLRAWQVRFRVSSVQSPGSRPMVAA